MVVLSYPESIDLVSQASDPYEVRIPDTYTSIASNAFQGGNVNLQGILIPGSIKDIGESAFKGKFNRKSGYYSKPVRFLGEGLESIGPNAFALTKFEQLDLPDSLISIDRFAFADSELQTISLGNNIQTIGQGAFQHSKVNHLTLPNSVTSIGKSSFLNNNLHTLVLSENLEEIPWGAFQGNGKIQDLKIPESVKSIGTYAFYGSGLTGVQLRLPSKLSSLGKESFAYTNISSVSIPGSLKSIGEGAFRGTRLRSIEIEEGVERIEEYAFYGSGAGSLLVIPDSVVSIGENAFGDIRDLNVELHENTAYSGTAFDGGTNITFRTDRSAPTSIFFTELSFTKMLQLALLSQH